MHPAAASRLWTRTRRLTGLLLGLWLALTVAGPWFAREFNTLQLFGFPLAYWLAAQGALLAYLLIVVLYVWRMDRLEDDFRADLAQPAAALPGQRADIAADVRSLPLPPPDR